MLKKMLTRLFLLIGTYFLCCKCENNVGEISKSGGIFSKFYENLQNNSFTNSRCLLDIVSTFDAAMRYEFWAWQMLDASGKFQSGLLQGNIVNLGSFKECMSVKGKTLSNNEISGKYCLSFLFMTNIQRSNIGYGLTSELRNLLDKNQGVPIVQAVCLPNSCSAKEMTDLLNSTIITKFLPVNIVFNEGFCVPEDGYYEFSILQWMSLVLLVAILLFVVLSTSYELYLLQKNAKPLYNILLSYSLYSNLKQLYRVRKDPDQLSCINGIRTLSLMWIILGHKYLIYATYPHVNYLEILEDWLKKTSTSLIIGAMFAVDTFFFLSGLLIIYVVLLAKAKDFNFSLIYYYLHRNLRLSPAFYMSILFYMTFLKYISSGPLWPLIHRHLENPCYNNWWYSILYIQNTLDLEEVCVNQSWYLAVDTQLYCLAPLIFIPLQRWPKRTMIIIVILAILSCFFGFGIAWTTGINGRVTEITKEFHILYCSIFYRCNAWLIGTLLGYYLFIKRGEKVKINKVVVSSLWILSIFTMLSMVLMEEYFYQYEYNKWVTSIYYAISKTLWCISLSWVIFACVHGYGGKYLSMPARDASVADVLRAIEALGVVITCYLVDVFSGLVNKFLSMKFFMITGRLTYSMYIIHIAYLTASIFHGETNTLLTNSSTLYEYVSDLVIIIIIAHIWTLTFETPLISMGKIFMPQELAKKLTTIHENNENINTSTENYNTAL